MEQAAGCLHLCSSCGTRGFTAAPTPPYQHHRTDYPSSGFPIEVRGSPTVYSGPIKLLRKKKVPSGARKACALCWRGSQFPLLCANKRPAHPLKFQEFCAVGRLRCRGTEQAARAAIHPQHSAVGPSQLQTAQNGFCWCVCVRACVHAHVFACVSVEARGVFPYHSPLCFGAESSLMDPAGLADPWTPATCASRLPPSQGYRRLSLTWLFR